MRMSLCLYVCVHVRLFVHIGVHDLYVLCVCIIACMHVSVFVRFRVCLYVVVCNL